MTTTVDQRRRALTPFRPGDVLEIERQGPDVVVLKRTRREKDQNRKEKSNRRLKRLCDALQRERNPVKIREIKNRLSDEFYNGDRA